MNAFSMLHRDVSPICYPLLDGSNGRIHALDEECPLGCPDVTVQAASILIVHHHALGQVWLGNLDEVVALLRSQKVMVEPGAGMP
jgi:hypothetical protein